mmetsp:Transcript_22656/g.89635  ORF Transcript_22656/g.89635 Transcript_22656/m.89635 type:complete len:215 (-) Transcript_22656:889-1533(-)
MGRRKSVISLASFSANLYFSRSTFSSGQCLSCLMARRSPRRVKYSFAFLPCCSMCFGRPRLLQSSSTSARWSSLFVWCVPFFGLNKRSPVASSKTMQAMLQMSADVLYLWPMMTSGARYCRVWMSSVKCLCTQQALPRSATFTVVTASSLLPFSSPTSISSAPADPLQIEGSGSTSRMFSGLRSVWMMLQRVCMKSSAMSTCLVMLFTTGNGRP